MSSIGPDLPPHLLKRKHDDDDDGNEAESSSSRSSSPDAASKKRRVAGPAPPPARSSTPPRRVMGPAPPPAPLEERPSHSPSDPRGGGGGGSPPTGRSKHAEEDDSDSSSDDGYGPALPSAHGAPIADHSNQVEELEPQTVEKKRDDWMLAPPDSSSSLAHRMDPTKRQPRGFNTGKSARTGDSGGSGELSALWTETPEQKKQRLANEVLGVSSRATDGKSKQTEDERAKERAKKERDENVARQVKDYDNQYRSKSLYQEHQDRAARERKDKDREDDPSKRAWDYEKDMNGGRKIGYSQRQEMLKKASGFGSRFTRGSYS